MNIKDREIKEAQLRECCFHYYDSLINIPDEDYLFQRKIIMETLIYLGCRNYRVKLDKETFKKSFKFLIDASGCHCLNEYTEDIVDELAIKLVEQGKF